MRFKSWIHSLILISASLGIGWLALSFAQQTTSAEGDTGADWKRAAPSFDWSFPRDHWPHRDFKTEWWYFTGHLQDRTDPSQRLGYQFTLFRVGLAPQAQDVDSNWSASSLLMGHASLTDLKGETHRFSEVLYREVPHLATFEDQVGERIAESLGPPGTASPWTLDWNGAGFDLSMADAAQGWSLALTTTPERPMTLHGDRGYSRKSAASESASHYYSFTRLQTRGTVVLGDRTFEVTGRSWMDKEFSSDHIDADQVGWDWMSLQLDDGSDWMLFQLRDEKEKSDFTSATHISATGETTTFENEALTFKSGRRWKSPATRASYPIEWQILLPQGRRIEVIAVVEGQENIGASGIFYWEGAVEVREAGAVIGRGYLEMTGYGKNSRPPI